MEGRVYILAQKAHSEATAPFPLPSCSISTLALSIPVPIAKMLANTTMLRIGVLLVAPIQLLDVAPIDLFAMTTVEYFKSCNRPQELIDIAIPNENLSITYIAASGANTSSPTSASLDLGVDAGLNDPAVAPGQLDMLIIPGPPPALVPAEEELRFVRDHVNAGVELLTVCSGMYVAAHAGVLDGKKATGTAPAAELAKKFPGVKWEDKRYVNDGKIWTSGKFIEPGVNFWTATKVGGSPYH